MIDFRIACCLFFFITPVAAQDVPQILLDPQQFEISKGVEQTWRRPPEVRWAIVSACGGGGGGGVAQYGRAGEMRYATLSEGGGNGIVQTALVGPLVSDVYNVRIGAGGEAGKAGLPTVFTDGTLELLFTGGKAGGQVNYSKQRYEQTEGGAGLRSIFGAGGGGGTASLPQGTEPPVNSYCSGGGGGFFGMEFQKKYVGSKGAAGTLSIYPLPDIQRLANLMALLESLSKSQKLEQAQ